MSGIPDLRSHLPKGDSSQARGGWVGSVVGVERRSLGWKGDSSNSVVSDLAACTDFLLRPGIWVTQLSLLADPVTCPAPKWLVARSPCTVSQRGGRQCWLRGMALVRTLRRGARPCLVFSIRVTISVGCFSGWSCVPCALMCFWW